METFNLRSGYYISYISSITGGTGYDKSKDEYYKMVDYILDKNGIPINMGMTYICSNDKQYIDNLKIGDKMPKKFWQYHATCNKF